MNQPSEILDRLPPQDVRAETCVIGSVLLDSRCLYQVAAVLRPADFYAEANQTLYRRMLAMDDAGDKLDVVLLVNALRRAGELEPVGGTAYIADCARSVPYASNALHYARIVARKAKLRTIIHAATDLLRDAYGDYAEPEELLAHAEKGLAEIHTGRYETEPATMTDALSEAMTVIDEIITRKRSAGVMVGLPVFDEQVGGVFPGELTIIAARPGQGKTSMAMQFALHAASKGRRVYVATLEMSRVELAIRAMCSASGVSQQRVRNGEIGERDMAELSQAGRVIAYDHLVLHDWPAIRVYDIRRAARRLKPELIVVDYLQLVTPSDKTLKRYEQVGQVAAGLKELARELKVPVVACAQLNRQTEQGGRDTAPRLAHLKESGKIEEDADMVLLLHRPKDGIAGKGQHEGERWDASLDVAKNRNGCTPVLRLNWDGSRTRFRSFESQTHAEFDGYSEGSF